MFVKYIIAYPVLVGSKLMLHTVLSFVAVAGGLLLLGATGAVLGPLILVVSLTLADILKQRIANVAATGSKLAVP